MLVLKIIGSLMIILSSSLIGNFLGSRYSHRLKNLIQLQNCIQLLETEIVYSATPLPVALENIYKKGNKNISFIFNEIKDYLISNKNISVYDSFLTHSQILKEKLFFTDQDIEIFLSLGQVLGASDRLDQQKHLRLIITQLKNQQEEALENKNKNERMYKSLGVLTGLAIVIVLL